MHLDEAYDDNNIFAKILRGDLPCFTVYEDEQTLAFMDIMPQSPGHVLVIPKNPSTNMLTIAEEDVVAVMRTTHKIAPSIRKAMGAEGFMVVQLNGSEAGQTVPHLHMHIVPRQGGIDIGFHARDVADMDELAAIGEKIAAQISADLSA
jgi:histidine triad (HIT) family protein